MAQLGQIATTSQPFVTRNDNSLGTMLARAVIPALMGQVMERGFRGAGTFFDGAPSGVGDVETGQITPTFWSEFFSDPQAKQRDLNEQLSQLRIEDLIQQQEGRATPEELKEARRLEKELTQARIDAENRKYKQTNTLEDLIGQGDSIKSVPSPMFSGLAGTTTTAPLSILETIQAQKDRPIEEKIATAIPSAVKRIQELIPQQDTPQADTLQGALTSPSQGAPQINFNSLLDLFKKFQAPQSIQDFLNRPIPTTEEARERRRNLGLE